MANVFLKDEKGTIYEDGEKIFVIDVKINQGICDMSGDVHREIVLNEEANRIGHTKNYAIDRIIETLESMKD